MNKNLYAFPKSDFSFKYWIKVSLLLLFPMIDNLANTLFLFTTPFLNKSSKRRVTLGSVILSFKALTIAVKSLDLANSSMGL